VGFWQVVTKLAKDPRSRLTDILLENDNLQSRHGLGWPWNHGTFVMQGCQLTMSGCADVTESLEETLKVVRPSGVKRWDALGTPALGGFVKLNGSKRGIDYQI